jgi:superfamily I DNA/RNA helicase
MTWWIPEHKLDDGQKAFLEKDINAHNYWIKGFPGSGKSVLLAHTIKKIRKKNEHADIAVVVFTHSLIKMFQAAFAEMGQYAEIMTYYDNRLKNHHYDYVLCDEVQDFVPQVLDSVRTNGAHVIVAGDENQSIYDTDPKFFSKTVEPYQIPPLVNAEPYDLNIIHRLSRSIIGLVQRLLPTINIFAAKRDMTKQDTQVRLCKAETFEDEVKYVIMTAEKAVNVGKTVAILIPTHPKIIDFVQKMLEVKGKNRWQVQNNQWGKPNYANLNYFLSQQGIKMQYVGNSYGEFSDDSRKITLMTYHSSKGLDFDVVFMPGLNRGDFFINSNEQLSQRIFMVAMTRSRGELYLSYSMAPCEYVERFASACSQININDSSGSVATTAIDEIDEFGGV